MENKILEVGDVLYNDANSPTQKMTVSRITKTMATNEKVRLKRESYYNGKYAVIGSYGSFVFGNNETESKYSIHVSNVVEINQRNAIALKLCSQTSFKKLTLDQLQRITAIVNE